MDGGVECMCLVVVVVCAWGAKGVICRDWHGTMQQGACLCYCIMGAFESPTRLVHRLAAGHESRQTEPGTDPARPTAVTSA